MRRVPTTAEWDAQIGGHQDPGSLAACAPCKLGRKGRKSDGGLIKQVSLQFLGDNADAGGEGAGVRDLLLPQPGPAREHGVSHHGPVLQPAEGSQVARRLLLPTEVAGPSLR